MFNPTNIETRRAKDLASGLRVTLWGILLNFFLAGIKAIAGVLGHSYALIADATESTADIFTSIVVWFGIKLAAKAPDEDHPYGHGKAEPLTAVFVSLAMLSAAAIIAFESAVNIVTPHELPAWYTLPILGGIIIIKESLFRYASRTAEEINSSAVKSDAAHHRADVITSVTAFVGVSIALIGGKGFEAADDWAALAASFIIVYNAIHIFRPAFSEIMDKAPPKELVEDVKAIAMTVPGVKGIDKCFIRKMGYDYYIDIHVIVDGALSVREGHDIGHEVKNKLRLIRPWVSDVLTHIEPV